MNIIENYSGHKVFDVFNEKYGDICFQICNLLQKVKIQAYEKTELLKLFPEKNSDFENTPFGFYFEGVRSDSNLINAYIMIDKNYCMELNLEEKELLASIGHEVSHIMLQFHSQKRIWNKSFEEFMADIYTAKIGLKDSLITTLEKLCKSNKYKEENLNEIKNRIKLIKMEVNRM